MGKYLEKSCAMFRTCKQGAALLMVLLVTMFVIIMGSSVLFTSYNGYIIRLVDRESQNTFYTTEELMDLVRVSVQEIASEALSDSYTRVMAEYSFIVEQYADENLVQMVAQEKFNQYFMEELSKVTTGGTIGSDLFLTNTSGGVLDLTNLSTVTGYFDAEYLFDKLPDEVKIGSAGNLASLTTPETTSISNLGNVIFTTNETGYPRLVLEDITIGYVTSNGYQTNITTDIVIEMPVFTNNGELNQGNSSYVPDVDVGVPFRNVATVARYWVKCSTDSSVAGNDGLLVRGDIYGGTFFVYNDTTDPVGNTAAADNIIFSHGDGKLITHDDLISGENASQALYSGTLRDRLDSYRDIYGSSFVDAFTARETYFFGIEVFDGTNFISEKDSQIWTSNINIYPGSDVELKGTVSNGYGVKSGGTYVWNDLMVAGGLDIPGASDFFNRASDVVLAGDYVGFGNSATVSAESSAIVLLGDRIHLDMTELSSIALAGTTFLQTGNSSNSVSYNVMGQSIGSAPDQIAYLIPSDAITAVTSNPFFDGPTGNSVQINTGHTLWGNKTIGDYVNPSDPVITISRQFTGGKVLNYYFFKFSDNATASQYLQDYVNNSDNFQENLELFVDMEAVADSLSVESAGSFYYIEADAYGNEQLKIVGAADMSDLMAANYLEQFKNISTTLETDRSYKVSDDYPLRNIDGTEKKDSSRNPVYHDNPFDYYLKHIQQVGSGTAASGTYISGYDPETGEQEKVLYVQDYTTPNELLIQMFASINEKSKLEFEKDGKVMAIYSDNAIQYGSDSVGAIRESEYPDVCMLIAYNGIFVYEMYEGLAFARAGIAIDAPIFSNPEGVDEAMNASYYGINPFYIKDSTDWKTKDEERDVYLYEFFQNIEISGGGDPPPDASTPGNAQAEAIVNWSPNDLVYYENWERH